MCGATIGRMKKTEGSRRRRPGRPKHDDVLTPAEWRTVHAVTHGMSGREIAKRRGISIDAVKYHVSNALAKLNLGSRKQLRQWFNVPRHSALSKQEKEMDEPRLGPIGQIARTVKSAADSERWYRDVLGLPHLYTFGSMAFFDCGGTRLALMEKGSVSADESVLYLNVGDIAATCEHLKSRGVEFISAPHMIHRHPDGTEEWMAFFRDLEGRPLAVMSQVR